MFSSSTFKTFVLLSILLRHVIGNSNPHPALQTGSDLPSSLDLHSDLSSRNDFADAPSSNAEYAILLSEQASSLSPLDNGENVGSLVGAESDGCSSSTSTTQLSNKMRRRVKRDKGICDATQDTNQPDPITQPDQEQRGRQGNDGKNNPSSKNSPSMKPSPRPLKNGGADELCLSHGFFYRVCAPAYLESKIHLTNYNLDQCRPCRSFSPSPFPTPPPNQK